MTKKNFAVNFYSAVLRKTEAVWYIDFHTTPPNADKPTRYRKTFGLNRKRYVENPELREQRAKEFLILVNMSIPFGYPHSSPLLSIQMATALSAKNFKNNIRKQKKKAVKKVLTVREASSKAIREKYNVSGNNDTIRKYLSHQKLFFKFLEGKKWLEIPLRKFKPKMALAYMEHIVKVRRVGDTTWNNNLRDNRTMFTWMMQKPRKWIKNNPFGNEVLKYKPKTELKHKILSISDTKIIANYIFEHDKKLFLALLLMYIGFARPKEIRRLRKEDFRVKEGFVKVPGVEGTKTSKDKFLTIPDDFKIIFEGLVAETWFAEIPDNWFIWGRLLQPNLKIMCGERSLSGKHKIIIRELYKKKRITTENYQWYDWKRRGITNALDEIKLLHVQEQANHTKPETTLIYRHPSKINSGMKKRSNDLIQV